MKRIVSALLALAVLAALVIVTTTSKHSVRAVYAQSGCSNATLTGSYGWFTPFQFDNKNKKGGGFYTPAANQGTFTADGVGNWSAAWTSATNGVITLGQMDVGTYTVNSDCTDSISDSGGQLANFVIVSGGTEFFGIFTIPGSTQEIDAKKQ